MRQRGGLYTVGLRHAGPPVVIKEHSLGWVSSGHSPPAIDTIGRQMEQISHSTLVGPEILIVSAHFMVFFKLFILPIQTFLTFGFLTYDSTIHESHDSRTTRQASIANKSIRPGNCYVYTNPPPSYRPSKSPSTGEASTTASHTSRSSPTASGSFVRGSSSDLTRPRSLRPSPPPAPQPPQTPLP